MKKSKLFRVACVGACLFFAQALAIGDTLTLNDGTVLEGTVIRQGDRYWIKFPTGESKFIDRDDVKSFKPGAVAKPAEPKTDTPATDTPSADKPNKAPADKPSTDTPSAEKPDAPKVTGGQKFNAVKAQADAVEIPLTAVILWQDFIDSDPPPEDLPKATEECARWQKMSDEGAAKVNGKWLTGQDLEEFSNKVGKVLKDVSKLIEERKTLQALDKLKEANRLYPDYYPVAFDMGYISLFMDKYDEAKKYFERCQKIDPREPRAINNLALIHWHDKDWLGAVSLFHKSARMHDDRQITMNLCAAIGKLPGVQAQNPKMKPIIEDAKLLALEYNIDVNRDWSTEGFYIALAPYTDERPHSDKMEFLASGTGFIINDDGLILTNRHVVKHADKLLVRVNGESRRGEIVVIDDKQDLALVRVKLKNDTKLPVLTFAANPPSEGAQCVVMGFPLLDRMGAGIKITQGIISGKSSADADLITDAKVNPGNSGGPLVDNDGRVLGVVTLKSRLNEMEDSYGMAISTTHIRKFLEKNKITVKFDEAKVDKPLSVEDVVKKVRPATVCIIVTGKMPADEME